MTDPLAPEQGWDEILAALRRLQMRTETRRLIALTGGELAVELAEIAQQSADRLKR